MGGKPPVRPNDFDAAAARLRCADLRRRVLEMSQRVMALHVGGAFSCTEIVDCIYKGLMRRDADGTSHDTFLMSKGHSAIIQYVILESLGVMTTDDLAGYCKMDGALGVHPDYGNPGIEASTGSLGHGLSMAAGMAIADKVAGADKHIYVLLSDGEVQEGSTWEAAMLASSKGLTNLTAVIDANDLQSLERTSVALPSFYPVADKWQAFGWEVAEADGHDGANIFRAATGGTGDKPLVVVAKTTKGKGVSYMENVPMWHYRSPSPEEHAQALREIDESLK